MSISLTEFATKLSDIVQAMPLTKTIPSIWMRRLTDHFGMDPSILPILEAEYPQYQHPCIQVAIESYLTKFSCTSQLIGVGMNKYKDTLGELLDTVSVTEVTGEGPVRYFNAPLGEERTLSCVERGMYLICKGDDRLALCLFRRRDSVSIEIMAPQRILAEECLSHLWLLIDELSVYRAQILSLEDRESTSIKFHKLDPVSKDSLVLPDGLLDKVEQNTVHFAKYKHVILGAGLPIKRGILLHGLPGTGKSLTIKYLLSKLGKRTTFLVHGHGLRSINNICSLARTLQPSTVVIEDVDLVAEDRRYASSNPVLIELLNEMDGLANDTDILFILTTNRPEVLEPALRSRPGRIDQAIEIPLPDENCRKLLFDLYTKGLHCEITNLKRFIDQTKGSSPVLIRELVRRAVLLAALDGNESCLQDRHLESALQALVVNGGQLTKSIVGFSPRNEDYSFRD